MTITMLMEQQQERVLDKFQGVEEDVILKQNIVQNGHKAKHDSKSVLKRSNKQNRRRRGKDNGSDLPLSTPMNKRISFVSILQ